MVSVPPIVRLLPPVPLISTYTMSVLPKPPVTFNAAVAVPLVNSKKSELVKAAAVTVVAAVMPEFPI